MNWYLQIIVMILACEKERSQQWFNFTKISKTRRRRRRSLFEIDSSTWRVVWLLFDRNHMFASNSMNCYSWKICCDATIALLLHRNVFKTMKATKLKIHERIKFIICYWQIAWCVSQSWILITKMFEKTSKLYRCERLLSIFFSNDIRKALVAKRIALNEYNVKKHLKRISIFMNDMKIWIVLLINNWLMRETSLQANSQRSNIMIIAMRNSYHEFLSYLIQWLIRCSALSLWKSLNQQMIKKNAMLWVVWKHFIHIAFWKSHCCDQTVTNIACKTASELQTFSWLLLMRISMFMTTRELKSICLSSVA